MDKSRADFEETIGTSPFSKSIARWPNLPVKFAWPGGYKELDVDLAWQMWQASRKQTLEDSYGRNVKTAEGDGLGQPAK